MRIQIRPTLVFGNKSAKDPIVIDLVWLAGLLKDIDQGKTLMAACKKVGLSYRNVWQKVNEVEMALGFQLIERVRGHGSHLSEYAKYLIHFLEDFDEKTRRLGQTSLAQLEEGFALFRNKTETRWRLASSSDPIIQKAVTSFDKFDLTTAGSGEALERLFNDEVDIAGYHVSDPQASKTIAKRLQKEGMQFFPVMKRVQGLMLAKGNPHHILGVKDLLRPQIRFINRQKSSGTRLLLDTVLSKEGIDTKKIKGYEHEEFTHTAIATSILAKKADVGVGVKSIAIENGLDFIQLKEELFFLAMPNDLALNKEVIQFIRKIRQLSGAIPGYKAMSLKHQMDGWI